MDCKHCGSYNLPEAKFCQGCGQSMPAPAKNTAAADGKPSTTEPAVKNPGGMSEVMFFTEPERPQRNKTRREPLTLEAGIILAVILLSIGAYYWIEQSNVVKQLGQSAAVKQQQKILSGVERRSPAKPVAASPLKEAAPIQAPIQIEPPQMVHVTPPTAVAAAPEVPANAVSATHGKHRTKAKPAVPVEMPPIPAEQAVSDVAAAAPAAPAIVEPPSQAQYQAQYEDLATEMPAPAVMKTTPKPEQNAHPSRHNVPVVERHLASASEPERKRSREAAKPADQVQEFLVKWRKSIRSGATTLSCSPQQQSLNQCHP